MECEVLGFVSITMGCLLRVGQDGLIIYYRLVSDVGRRTYLGGWPETDYYSIGLE